MDNRESVEVLAPTGYFAILDCAHARESAGDLVHALALASEAIRIAPHIGAAYHMRGRLHRLWDDLDSAVEDFGALVKLDPKHEEGWRYLGSSFTLKAAGSSGMERTQWLRAAHGALSRAAQLRPDGLVHWLDLAEAELCMGDHRVAAGTAAMSWARAQGAQRSIAAWLGGIANALAGRPQSAWSHFTAFLESGLAAPVTKSEWATTEIETYLGSLRAGDAVEVRRVALADSVHTAFMRLYRARKNASAHRISCQFKHRERKP